MIINFMAEKLIISFKEYTKIVEKLAVLIHKKYKPTVLVGIMRGAAPIIDILSRILKLPIAYIVIQSYSGKGMEDQQGQLMFAREISSLANNEDFNKVLLIDDLSDTGLTLNKSIEWLKQYRPIRDNINEVITFFEGKEIKGEITIVVKGVEKKKDLELNKPFIVDELQSYVEEYFKGKIDKIDSSKVFTTVYNTFTPTNAVYTPTTGQMVITIGSHTLTTCLLYTSDAADE